MSNIEAKIYTQEGKDAGTLDLPAFMFDVPWNADLVSQVVHSMQSNARRGTAHTKDRSEVRGGGKKPWRQKGTGRARHGSRRSPIWVGGGVTHGPRSDKNYDRKINKRMKEKALWTVLSAKYRDGEVLFVDSLAFPEPKTKDAKKVLGALAKTLGNTLSTKRKNAAVIAIPEQNSSILKSFSNIGSVIVDEVRMLNPLELLNNKYLVFVSPTESLKVLEGRKVVKK